MSIATIKTQLLKPLILFLSLWGVSTGYLAFKGADWTFPIVSLMVFGVALTSLAVLATQNAAPPPVVVPRPALETKALLVYLTIYAFVLLGWALGAVRDAVAGGQAEEVAVILLKLLAHVAIPCLILAAMKAPLAPLFDSGLKRPGFWLPLVIFGTFFLVLFGIINPSLKEIGALGATPIAMGLGVAGAFVWIAIEAGLNEEFFFRAVLQSRFTAFMNSAPWAIVITSLLFALAHVPGLYLRGTPETEGWSTDPIQVVAFTIATLAPISIFFGAVWARTRSLLLVVLLHASVDVLQFAPEFMKTWGLA